MQSRPILLDSITDADSAVRGQVVISGSHGGLYPATVAAGLRPRAVLFHDAGIGLDDAGVAGVMALEAAGLASAAVDFASCIAGSAREMWARGRISRANRLAAELGVRPGMTVPAAVRVLAAAPLPTGGLPAASEVRSETVLAGGARVILVDSASLVGAGDAGLIVVTGSHGALVGGDAARALKARARVAVFNDAGLGAGEIARSRLPALQAAGVAAVLVSCRSARIGDAASTLATGVISFANRRARDAGAAPGQPLRAWLENLVTA